MLCYNVGMENQFSRTEILLGEEGVARLRRAHVAVFGIGGVGGHCAEALARSGVGALTLVDRDVVSVSNLNRQIVALRSTLGRPKAEVMRERILDIDPGIRVDARTVFFGPENADDFEFSVFDYVVDAVDTVAAKTELAVRAERAGVPAVSCMGAGNKLDPTRFEVADLYATSVCPLARAMRRELRARGVRRLKVVFSREEPAARGAGAPGSVAFVPSAAGLVLASVVVRELAGV